MDKKTLVAAMAALMCAAAAFAQEGEQVPEQQQIPEQQQQVQQQQQIPEQHQEAKAKRNIRKYGKLSVSKEKRTKDSWKMKMDGTSFKGDGKSNLTMITPTFGATGNRFAFELGVGFGVGETSGFSPSDSDDYSRDESMVLQGISSALSGNSIFAIIPRADLVWHLRNPDSFFVPFAHFGIGVPIQIGDTIDIDDVSFFAVSFEVSLGGGLLFNMTERLGLLMDARFAFGPSGGYAVSLGTRFK